MNSRRNPKAEIAFALICLCLFIYGLLCCISCSAPRSAVSSQKDSVRTVITERVVYRDTIIEVPVPVESDRAVLEDSDTSMLRTSLAESEAFVSGGKLHHTLRNRSELVQPINLKMPLRFLNTDRFQLAAQTITVEVERELTAWQKFMQALGLGCFVAVCALALWFAVRILKKFI